MKKYFTKAELKENAQAALRKIYGFAPSRKDIKLMKAVKDHYGSGAVKIISAKAVKYDKNGSEVY